MMVQELLGLVARLAGAGIDALPFKGPALAVSAYGNLALRQFADLDILVRERDHASAKALLASLGYRWQAPLTSSQESCYLDFDCQQQFLRDDGEVMVELHWALAPKYFAFAYEGERLWRGLTRASLGGADVLGFCPEDLLLILCAHGAKHSWERLGWICDVAEMIRAHPQLDWARLLAEARELGAERMLRIGLLLAHALLDAPLPVGVARKLERDPAAGRLAASVTARLLGRQQPLTPYAHHVFHLRARERLRDRCRYLFRLATTPGPREWAVVTLPGSLYFLYYGVRAARLLGKYLRRSLLGTAAGSSLSAPAP
jgi:hypothetical protein